MSEMRGCHGNSMGSGNRQTYIRSTAHSLAHQILAKRLPGGRHSVFAKQTRD